MPYLPVVGTLVKSDRRSQWSVLKSKHSKAISTKKIDFDGKLGPALDKFQVQVKAVDKLFAAEQVSQPAIQKLLTTSRPLRGIADYYLDKVKGLGNPAEKELTAFLKAVNGDCLGWEQVLDMLEETISARVSPAQMAAMKELYGLLDALSGQLINLNRSVPAAVTEMKSAPKKMEMPPKYTGPLSEKAWRQSLGAKAEAIVASAAQLDVRRSAVQKELAPLLTASIKFNAHSDYQTFKDRARTVSAGTLTAFQQQAGSFAALQNDPEFKSQLGFLKGLPTIDFRRASISAGQARDYADELIKRIQQMP